MSEIQIPQRNPPAPQFQPPNELVTSYLNRPTGYQIGTQALGQGINSLLENYYKQQQLKAAAFEAGGPYLMNQLYGNGNQPSATTNPVPSSNTTPPVAGTPGGTAPGNYGASPQTTAQTLTAPQQPPIPETIQATLDHPVLGTHAKKIMDIQNQMAQNSQMGKYGQTVNMGLSDQLKAEQALMGQEQFQQGQAAEESRFERGQGQKESQFERGKNAETTSKVAEALTPMSGVQQQINDLKNAFTGYKPIPFLGEGMAKFALKSGSANVGGKTAQQGATIERITPSLAANINYMLSHRFSPLEAQLIKEQVVPTAQDSEPIAKQKIANVQAMFDAYKAGNMQQLQAVASSVAGRPVEISVQTAGPQKRQSVGPQGATVKQGGYTYTWNGTNYE